MSGISGVSSGSEYRIIDAVEKRKALAENIEREFRKIRNAGGDVLKEIAAKEGKFVVDYTIEKGVGKEALGIAISETKRVVHDVVTLGQIFQDRADRQTSAVIEVYNQDGRNIINASTNHLGNTINDWA